MDRKLFFTFAITLLLGGLGYLLFQIAEPFLTALMWAGILVTVTYPLYRRLLEKLPKQRELAAGLMCIGLTLVVVLPLTLLLLVLFKDLREGAQGLYNFLHGLDYKEVMKLEGPLFENPIMQQLRDLIERNVNMDQIDLRQAGLQAAQRASQFLLNRSKGVLGAFGGFVFQLILIELSMFFLFRDGPRFLAFVRRLIPLEVAKKDIIFARMREVIQATMFGSLGTALVQGTIGGILMIILGLPSAVLWAVVMTFSSFLPLVGTSLVWVPAAIYFAVQGAWIKMILMVAGGLFISTVDNFIRPMLIRSVSSEDNQLNTLVLFMSVLGGIRVFGFLGIVLGPLLVVLFLTLLELLYAYMGYDIHLVEMASEPADGDANHQSMPPEEAQEVSRDVHPPETGIDVQGSSEPPAR